MAEWYWNSWFLFTIQFESWKFVVSFCPVWFVDNLEKHRWFSESGKTQEEALLCHLFYFLHITPHTHTFQYYSVIINNSLRPNNTWKHKVKLNNCFTVKLIKFILPLWKKYTRLLLTWRQDSLHFNQTKLNTLYKGTDVAHHLSPDSKGRHWSSTKKQSSIWCSLQPEIAAHTPTQEISSNEIH